ncbi:MAG TPA: metal-sulfur cluster assembly factor [Candidatus Baltobacteraceae bacterium]|nr:metal-sulfur cluster assembly factor [Candidatus Baltobacteraceae bacterium]
MKDERCAQVVQALRSVIDPELGINVVALGLVYAIGLEGEHLDRVDVVMTLTTPGCPMHGTITADAKSVIASLPWVANAHVTLTWEPPWTPDRMTGEARELLGR